MSNILPPNATQLERDLVEALAQPFDEVGLLRDICDPENCPAAILPWLAWERSADEWVDEWSEEQKRSFVSASLEVHRRKGTFAAVRAALGALEIEAQAVEWFNQSPAGAPFTFSITLTVDQVGIGGAGFARVFEVIDRTKNLRSHISGVGVAVRSEAVGYAGAAVGIGQAVTISNFIIAPVMLRDDVVVI